MLKAKSNFIFAIVLLVVVSLGLGGFALSRMIQPPGKEIAEIPQPVIEARYGVRFTRIAMTADGGLVDIRYVVVNNEGNMDALMDGTHNPVLIATDGKQVFTEATMTHKVDHEIGQTYWMIYYNTNNALHSGSVIDIQIGDVLIENVKVQ